MISHRGIDVKRMPAGVFLSLVVAVMLATGPAKAANKGTALTASNSPMDVGDYITSPNGEYVLTMQASGNMVASSGNWTSNTPSANGSVKVIGTSGDLIVYNSAGVATYHSALTIHRNAYLTIDDSGDVQMLNSAGAVIATNFPMFAL